MRSSFMDGLGKEDSACGSIGGGGGRGLFGSAIEVLAGSLVGEGDVSVRSGLGGIYTAISDKGLME